MRVLFAGTPVFSVAALEMIAEQHEVIGVFTQPDRRSGRGKKITESAVKIAAKSRQFDVYQPESLRDQSQLISELTPDVMVVVAYGVILPQAIIDIPKYGCLNIHASLLPRWRGAAPIQRAIEAGDSESGVCIMQMEAGLDTGPVLETLRLKLDADTTAANLHDHLSVLGAKGISSTLARIERGDTITAVEQDDKNATYAKKINKTEADINWSHSAQTLERRIRAFNPWPIMQTCHSNTRLRVWRASISEQSDKPSKPGEVIALDERGLCVACGDGVLRLEVLQRDGSKAMDYKTFSNGYEIGLKDLLG